MKDEIRQDERCAVCNLAPPTKPGVSHYSLEVVQVPDHGGWMRMFYPWPENHQPAQCLEQQFCCPKCAKKVAEFIKHLATPMVDTDWD